MLFFSDGATPARRLGTVFSLSLAVIFVGCGGQAPVQQAKAQPEPPVNLTFDDAAKFLAGIKGSASTEFTALQSNPSWQDHASQMESLWGQFQKTQLTPAVDFQKRELAPLSQPNSFVFYPFGGPDVIYATTFYPQGKTYVLAGLEPVGAVPTPATFAGANLPATFGQLRNSAGIFRRSFFVTSEMDQQFRKAGVTPMLLMLLSRLGNQIRDVRLVDLTPEGQLTPSSRPKPNGVEITFRRTGGAEDLKLFYFSGDVRNEKLEANPSWLKFLEAKGRCDTLIKSASFLLHWREFTRMRQHVLEHSDTILQDDTGIPFRVLSKEYKVSFYGKYSAPDKPFKGHYQKELAAAFEQPGNVRELGFSLGYGYGRRTSHLVYARREKVTAQNRTAETTTRN